MAVDTTEQGSPGWWMQRLGQQLAAKQARYEVLDAYWRGEPPLAVASAQQQTAFYALQRTARSNFAALIVQAPRERLAVRAFRTAVVNDDNGDDQAWAVWTANDLDIAASDVHRMLLEFSEAYVSVGMPQVDADADGDVDPVPMPLITAEDPRQMIGAWDPTDPRRMLAAFKIFHDDIADEDRAYLWLPGEMWVATRPRAVAPPQPTVNLLSGQIALPPFQPVGFSPMSFTMDTDLSETFDSPVVPVVRFANRDGYGEYEQHTDLLDRINHEILQRIVITTLQAFKQRAIKTVNQGDLPETDDAGNPIDYNNIFAADPGALWMLPPGAEIQELTQADITGILSAVKDDVLHLAAVTRTPMAMFTPDAATQSAEGASFMREGLVYKVEDLQRICGRSWARVMSLAFTFMGDAARADLGRLATDWTPAERYSLGERGAADVAATALSRKAKLQVIWGMNPHEVETTMAEVQDELVLQQQMALQSAAAANGLNAGQPEPAPDPAA